MPPESVLDTLRHLWRTLESLELPAALLGGLALSFWRHPRFTRDVDVLVAIGEADIETVTNRLKTAGFQPKGADPMIRLANAEFLQLLHEPPDAYMDVQVDLLLAQSDYQRQSLQRRIAIPASELGFEVHILTCEDLIIHKLQAGRMIDFADAGALLRENRTTIDLDYLRQWIAKEGLETDLSRVWNESFPDELK